MSRMWYPPRRSLGSHGQSWVPQLEQMDTGRHGGPPARTSGSAPRWCRPTWTHCTWLRTRPGPAPLSMTRPMLTGGPVIGRVLIDPSSTGQPSPKVPAAHGPTAPLLGTHLETEEAPSVSPTAGKGQFWAAPGRLQVSEHQPLPADTDSHLSRQPASSGRPASSTLQGITYVD